MLRFERHALNRRSLQFEADDALSDIKYKYIKLKDAFMKLLPFENF